MKVGVFDSGVGGLSVANAIKRALPEVEIELREDREHVPYGKRSPQEILGFITPIFQELTDIGCSAIVVACNTVTTTLITDLQQMFPVPLIGVEPMIEQAAAATKTGSIAVCATPTTLASQRYAQLKLRYAPDITVLEPDCSDWASMIEAKRLDYQKLDQRISDVLAANADVIVLACTHYHWIETEIVKLAKGQAAVLQPEQLVIARLKQVLGQPD